MEGGKEAYKAKVIDWKQHFEQEFKHLYTIVHGYLNRATVEANGWDTWLLDFLDEQFPNQMNLWPEGAQPVTPESIATMRENMFEVFKNDCSCAVAIGDVIEGVKIEVEMLEAKGYKVLRHP